MYSPDGRCDMQPSLQFKAAFIRWYPLTFDCSKATIVVQKLTYQICGWPLAIFSGYKMLT